MNKLIVQFIILLLIQFCRLEEELTTSSSSTTTAQSQSTTTTAQPNQNETTKDNQTDDLIFKNSTRYCSCDLTGNHCDLNCCCDTDCNFKSKKLFSKCLDSTSSKYRLLDSRYCYNQKIIYRNNTSFILERMTNLGGLFCIYTDNTKQQTYLMDKKIVKKLDEFNSLNLRSEYNWTTNSKLNYDLTTPELIETSRLAADYKAEKAIFLLKKLDQSKQLISLAKLKFPASLIIKNGECNSLKTVGYLVDFKSYCFKLIRNLPSECKPNTGYDVNSYSFILIGNGQLNYLESNLFIENLTIFCDQFKCLETQASNQIKAIAYENQVCLNAVRSVSYQIIHNEDGIQKVLVDFEYEDIKQLDNRPIRQFQKFEVKFVHENLLNKSINISHFSGNLGYQLERPLIGKFRINSNQKQASPFKFVNLQTDDDQCDQKRLNELNEQSILFGLNHRSGCFFNLNKNFPDFNKASSETICNDLDALILKVFQLKSNVNSSTFLNSISAYGKYNLTNLENWTPILKTKKSSASTIVENENSIKIKINCQLPKQLNFVFTYALVADSREPQRKLISAIQIQSYHSFEICLNSDYCKNEAIELSTSIQFIQMKAEKRIRFSDSPKFNLELPDDFFYPFLSN